MKDRHYQKRETGEHPRTGGKAQTFSAETWSSSTNVHNKDKAGGQLNHLLENLISQFFLYNQYYNFIIS